MTRVGGVSDVRTSRIKGAWSTSTDTCAVCSAPVKERRGKVQGTYVKIPGKKKYLIVCSGCQSRLRTRVGDRNIKSEVLESLD